MFFTHLPDMPSDMPAEQIDQANEWLSSNVATEMWITAQVCAEFKISQARLAQLLKTNKIPGHIQLGSTHLYIMRYARPWFEAYDMKVKSRRSVQEAKATDKAAKKGTRTKKDKEKWRTFTLYGTEHRIPDEYINVHEYWRREQVAGLKYLNETGQTGQITEDSKAFSQYLKDLQKALGME